MSVKIKDVNNIPKYIKHTLNEILSYEIQVGIFGEDDSEMLMIAKVHEFGKVIKAKKNRLCIPISKKSKGKSPRSFNDLFPLHTDDKNLYLVREKGKNDLEFLYWLPREVVIPERSFIRGGFDEYKGKIENTAKKLLKKTLLMEISATDYFNTLGEYAVGCIVKYMVSLKSPPNSSLTTRTKGSSNPLIDSGRLKDSITYKVVRV